MILADFCEDSTQSIFTILGSGNSKVKNMIQYYDSCNGTNPFNASISVAQSALSWMSGNVTELVSESGYCANDTNLLSSRFYIDDMYQQLGSFIDKMNCSSITPQYQR
jgi:hypothetical protein